jgi:hypothetical protein
VLSGALEVGEQVVAAVPLSPTVLGNLFNHTVLVGWINALDQCLSILHLIHS